MLHRQTVTSPWWCRGALDELRVSRSFLRSSRGREETRHRHSLPCPAMLGGVRASECARSSPGTSAALHAPPRAGFQQSWRSPASHPILHQPEAQIPLGLSSLLARVWRTRGWAELGTAPTLGHSCCLPGETPRKSRRYFCDPVSTRCRELSSGLQPNAHLSGRSGGGTWGWWGTCPGGCRWASRCSRGWRLVSAACQSSRRCPGGGEGAGLELPGAVPCLGCVTLGTGPCPLRLEGSPPCPASPLPRHRQQNPGFGSR